ncbi:MAG: hypothetical protein A2583_11955 [Bdellovibrionales bacterium RIFOXYD1_FULL_53_11]|nr:MAG: hypothetical protein A2583_11955 [Bdellovibrionales bacterium RIFOXYD1_FULL_53_11]
MVYRPVGFPVVTDYVNMRLEHYLESVLAGGADCRDQLLIRRRQHRMPVDNGGINSVHVIYRDKADPLRPRFLEGLEGTLGMLRELPAPLEVSEAFFERLFIARHAFYCGITPCHGAKRHEAKCHKRGDFIHLEGSLPHTVVIFIPYL